MRARDLLVMMLSLPLCACVTRMGGSVPQDRAIAKLRDEVALLKARADADQRRIRELESILAGVSASDSAAPEAARVLANLPAVTSIELDRFSGVDRAGKGVQFYVRTLDSRDMFTQGVGTLRVEVFAGRGESATLASPLASRTLSLEEFRSALRSGFAGTFYLVAVPVTLPSGPYTLRATFSDAISGRVHVATREKAPATQASVAIAPPLAKRDGLGGE